MPICEPLSDSVLWAYRGTKVMMLPRQNAFEKRYRHMPMMLLLLSMVAKGTSSGGAGLCTLLDRGR